MNHLKNIKNDHLLEKFSGLVAQEKEATAAVVRYLSEIYRRRLFALEGYSSLFSYLVEKYHYSRSAAYRRIQAAKASLRFPNIIDLLAQGRLNLMAVCLIEPYTHSNNGHELIKKVIGKTKEEIEYLISELFSANKETLHRDKIRRLPVIKKEASLKMAVDQDKAKQSPTVGPLKELNSPTVGIKNSPAVQEQKMEIRRVKIEFVADEKLAQKIDRAKEVLRHKYPKARLEDIFDDALEALLEKKAPERKIARIEKRKAQTAKAETLKKCHPERPRSGSGAGSARRISKKCSALKNQPITKAWEEFGTFCPSNIKESMPHNEGQEMLNGHLRM